MKRKNTTNLGFWAKLSAQGGSRKKPIFALTPMSDVTDEAFRQMFVKYGGPDIFWTEFISCDGLCSKGKKNLLIDLKFRKNEHPIVAQIFGANPENFYKCAKLINELGFDGIDINMGCPHKHIEKQGAGAALMKNHKLAQEIILATKEGARLRSGNARTSAKQAGNLPVSVKTRIGYNKNETETWIPTLLKAKPAAIILHGRTRKELSKTPARWDVIGRAAKIIKAKKSKTLIIGNGDIKDLSDARQKAKQYNLDGIMVGRATFGNPWFFNLKIKKEDVPLKKQLEVMLEHAVLFDKLYCAKTRLHPDPAKAGRDYGGQRNFSIMKKHFKAYASGFNGAKELRVKLMRAKDVSEVKKIVREFLLNQ